MILSNVTIHKLFVTIALLSFLTMSLIQHVAEALLSDDCKTNDRVKVTALPNFTEIKEGFEAVDLEACHTDSDMTVQEPSIMKKESLEVSESPTSWKRVWYSVSVLFVSIRKFWRTPEPDPCWKEFQEKIKIEKVEDYCKGIPQLAAFINSDDSFCVWRTFGQLHARILMQKQLELNQLETELQNLDQEDNVADETRYRLQIGERWGAWDPTQKDLVDKIAVRLSDYGDLLLKHHGLKSIPKPSESNYSSLLNHIWRTRPLEDGHFDFAFLKKDFVRLGPRLQSDELHDRLLRWLSHWSESSLNKLFRDSQQPQDGTAQYFLSHRIEFVIKSFITLLIISILMVPILLLYMIPMEKSIMVVVVLISLFVFAISLSLFRDSKPQDMFFGTATYCAVILVFLAGQSGANNMAVSSGT